MTAQIKLGITLLVAQIALIAMTYGFSGLLDRQAEADGIAAIITEATR